MDIKMSIYLLLINILAVYVCDSPTCISVLNKLDDMKFNPCRCIHNFCVFYMCAVLIKCPVCGYESKTNQCHRRHMEKHAADRTQYQCPECPRKFLSKDGINYHKRTVHSSDESLRKPFECSICKRTFGLQCVLKLHLRIHTGERPYPCSLCSKRFKRSEHRNIHMKLIHSDVRDFQCPHCEKTFNLKTSLTSHVRSIHCPSELRKHYNCTHCGKSFLTKRCFEEHQLTHNYREKSFVCAVCNIEYDVKNSLLRHVKEHHTIIAAK